MKKLFPTKKRILNIKYYILRINYVVKPICEFYFVTILVHVKETLSGIKKSWNFVVHSMLTW
jgi:hypothetical protein